MKHVTKKKAQLQPYLNGIAVLLGGSKWGWLLPQLLRNVVRALKGKTHPLGEPNALKDRNSYLSLRAVQNYTEEPNS
jgi:hypothetical protein